VSEQLDGINLGDEVYVGIFVVFAHPAVLEKAVGFGNVRIVVPAKAGVYTLQDYIGSDIEVLDIANGNSRILYQSPRSLQAPKTGRRMAIACLQQ